MLVLAVLIHEYMRADGIHARQAPAPASPARSSTKAPVLAIDASQREAIRGAAAPYRGSPVRILLYRPTPAYQAFARDLNTALESAGLSVSTTIADTYALPDCPERPGLRIMYGLARSGAVNAIAEALIRSGVVTESISGCSVLQEEEFTFILSSST
jgi:hypothetical protein